MILRRVMLFCSSGNEGKPPLHKGHDKLPLSAGDKPATKLKLEDQSDFSGARFMESYESKHSDQSFTSNLAKELGVTAAPLRLDSQAKYGVPACLQFACAIRNMC